MTTALNTKPFQRSTEQLNWAFLIPPQVGVPACAEGDPGIGKTKTLQALAFWTQREFFSYELAKTQPEDLLGFPVVSEMVIGEKTVRYMDFVPDRRLLEASLKPSILLFDELTNTIAPKQSAALTVVQDPPPDCWMFMACNPIESASDGQPLTCPMINRIWYGQWQIDTEAQDHGMRNQLDYPAPDVPIVPADYMRFHDRWGNIITNYFKFHPKERVNCPTDYDQKGKPWPSPRQWNNLSKCLAAADAVGASDSTRFNLVVGLIGATSGAQFLEYVNNLSLPDPQQLIENPCEYAQHGRYDVDIAIIASVVNHVRSYTDDEKVAYEGHLIALGEEISKANEELGAAYWGAICALHQGVASHHRTLV